MVTECESHTKAKLYQNPVALEKHLLPMIELRSELNSCENLASTLIPNIFHNNVALGEPACQNEDWPANLIRFKFAGNKSNPPCPMEWKLSVNVKFKDG